MSQYIDETDFVEAGEGRANLSFTDEKQQARFELGVSMMVHKWEALEVAVVNQWGGPESAEKRDWMTAVVVDLFKNEKIVDVQLIEETLMYAMFDEFETNVEDESALPIAAGIINIYRECFSENYSTVERLFVEWKENGDKKSAQKVVVSDSSDEEDEIEEEEQMDIEMEIEECTHDISDPNHSHGPVFDEDGFEVVIKKGRRKN